MAVTDRANAGIPRTFGVQQIICLNELELFLSIEVFLLLTRRLWTMHIKLEYFLAINQIMKYKKLHFK